MEETIRFRSLESEYKEKQSKAESTKAPKDIEAARQCCQEFKRRCVLDCIEIPLKLGDPIRAAERAALTQLYNDASTYLNRLEEHCPRE